MAYDFFNGFATLALKKPTQPVKTEPPKQICLHPGEDAGQYKSFLEVINDLAQAFKFLPESTGTILKNTFGTRYENLDFLPEASQWDLIMGIEGEGLDSIDLSILDNINDYFNWDEIRNMGGAQSYYQMASGGAISSFSDEEAFNFMCSMLESKERVFGAFKSIFGDTEGLGNDTEVIDHITSFMDELSQVDPHNIALLSMFFRLQTDLINELDAYMNCQTYWGGDGTSNLLMNKIDGYISTLSGGQKDAALDLESMWLTHMPRWDEVGGISTNDIVNTEGSWVNFFREKMDEINNEDAIRTVVSRIMNRSADQKFRQEKAEYEVKKDEAIMQEIYLQKLQAKRRSESNKSIKKVISRRTSVSTAMKAKAKGPSVIRRASSMARAGIRSAARPASRPVVKTSARPVSRSVPKHMAVGSAARRAPKHLMAGTQGIKKPSAAIGAHTSGSQGRRNANVQPKAQSQASQSQKHEKDVKKVI